nr:hypothetical protein DA06_02745 [Georgenia sp. SUBG003]
MTRDVDDRDGHDSAVVPPRELEGNRCRGVREDDAPSDGRARTSGTPASTAARRSGHTAGPNSSRCTAVSL